jgi:hypothetical protein
MATSLVRLRKQQVESQVFCNLTGEYRINSNICLPKRNDN